MLPIAQLLNTIKMHYEYVTKVFLIIKKYMATYLKLIIYECIFLFNCIFTAHYQTHKIVEDQDAIKFIH